ncbi:MAG: MmgE/PrpD family protein [Synergistetes bacterium]|nr:MmgE/PrpD family protein [Synergistota bacterium]MDW8192946.1 MmgE/PrpD family protein [Synergistota bacterium]
MTISERIGEFVSQTCYEDLPKSVVEATKRLILDWLGVGFRGSLATPSSWVLKMLYEGDLKGSTFLSYPPIKGNFLSVAFANAFFSHILEIDDVHRGSIYHPASPVISSAFSQAERLGSSGKDLITSIVLGYEVSIRVGECLGLSHYKYWHPTGTCGVFGSAVAGSKLLNLDPQKVSFAIGNAGTSASGLWQFNLDGAMTKPLHPAKAAMEGLICANLAYQGFSGASRIFEGEKGICKAMARDGFDLDKLTYGLGEKWKVEEVSFKPYPCCRHIHSPIYAAIEIYKRFKPNLDQVNRINVYTYKTAMETAHFKIPSSVEEARFSISYCVATALLFGKVDLDHFTPDSIKNEKVLSLIDKIKVIEHEEYTKAHPQKWGAKVEVLTENGENYSADTWFPKGDPENPMTDEEIEGKVRGLLSSMLPGEYLDELIKRVWSLEEISDLRLFF